MSTEIKSREGFTPLEKNSNAFTRATSKTSLTGFTLVETLVAISVLLLATIGPMGIAASGLRNAFYAREQIVGFYLAQEGIEIVRAIRDQNALKGESDWLKDIHASCDGTPNASSGGCGADMRFTGKTPDMVSCTGTNCVISYYTDTSGVPMSFLSNLRGFYSHVDGVESKFTRRIWVNEVTADAEAEIEVWVTWQTFLGTRSVTVRSRIFNQYEDLQTF